MTKKRYIIGVDLGATWVRLVLSDEEGAFLGKTKKRVDKSDEKAIGQQITTTICSLCEDNGVDPATLRGVGIASAGPLNMKKGSLIKPTNLPFEYVSLTKPIRKELGLPTYLINDCTAAVLGEKMFGAGKELDNLAYITIGTGIGGGVVVNGQLLLGKDGNAVEIGHLTIDLKGKLTCGCGKKGHWEAYCSGRNIPNFVKMRLGEIDKKSVDTSLLFNVVEGESTGLSSQDLFDAAKKGDKLSLQLVEEIGNLNAIGFADVINAYDPSLITVGGTVTLKNEKLILSPIKKLVGNYAVNRLPKITVTPLGDEVGLYGAVAAFLTLDLKT